ncbi:hypothetical protein [Priestia megaterium]|uniref:hypothetical protein n=1 Tax=Priestia megaterium TaxID=1404 RepID=UPI002877CD9A|nr:hypothetical protein [Priestia megaterium]
MGVNRSDWMVVGVDLGYDKIDDDNWDYYDTYSQRNKEGEMTFLIDGMHGDYFIVGEVILGETDEKEGFGLTELDFNDSDIEESKENVRAFIKKEFNIDVEPKLLVLTHWT